MEDYRVCGCISMGISKCDNCGRELPYGEKYAYVSDWAKDRTHGKAFRYCAECAIKLGWMHLVRDINTGRVFASIFCLKGEEIINETKVTQTIS